MHLKKLGIFIFCIAAFFQTFAQQKGSKNASVKFTGKVIDFDTKEPLEYATVVLKPLNGTQITGGITDSKGLFNIDLKAGNYDVSIEYISFKTYQLKNVAIVKSKDLGVIELALDAQALDEVEIIAEKSTVEIRLDKKIYNVGKDMTVKGGSASDVLDNVPSVTVDVEGNISLRGNDNVQILINGKPSGMIGLSGADALQQLPADAIQKVEVITSPSARYDAEGTSGILNIVLRKGKAQGFNGSVTATTGIPDNYGGSANLNYRTKKFNFFTNTGYSYTEYPGDSYNYATYFDSDNEVIGYRNEEADYDRSRNRFNTNMGVEYYITDQSSITGTFFYRDSKGANYSVNTTNEFDPSEVLTQTSIRTNDEDEKGKNIEYSLNFTHNFKTDGHKLTVDVQHSSDTDNEAAAVSDFTTYPSLIDNNPEKNATNDASTDFLVQSDYVLPLGKNAQFEAGFKMVLNDLTSDYIVEDFNPDSGEFENNTDFSNTLEFSQDIYSYYTQYGTKFNNVSVLLGLRAETTDRTIFLVQTEEYNQKKWTELFPTVNVGIEFNDMESLTIGFNRRLRRPRSRFLNPFESRTSETFIRKGNINLDPTYTSAFDVGYLKRWNKFTLNSSVYYQHSTNNIEYVQTEETREINGEPTLIIVTMPINLSSQDRYGFEFTANYNPFKWWKLNTSFNFYRAITEGDYDDVNYDADNRSWFTRINSTVRLPGNIDWQTRAMYRGPSESAQTKREGMLNIDLAFSKDILNENATISFNVSDLLNSRLRKSNTTTETTYTDSSFRFRPRSFRLNFTYRFNQKKKRERQRQQGFDGGEEEMFKA
ncbi:TonB-dependent receptor domain-containing protein [Lutibacter holmesii]|uniref:TonB-dependent receptor domain-containing protein n=1 Tax=Lutibacter holmesii TaxID=1137985 RepID=A0ABW3WRJ7_9FLAO